MGEGGGGSKFCADLCLALGCVGECNSLETAKLAAKKTLCPLYTGDLLSNMINYEKRDLKHLRES